MDENTAENAPVAESTGEVGNAADTDVNFSDSADTTPVEGANIESEPVQEQPHPEPTQTQAVAKRIKEAQQKARDAAYADVFKGQIDPYTQKPIDSEAAYKAYQARAEQEQARKKVTDAGYDPDMLATAYEMFKRSDPEIQHFRQVAEQMQKEQGRAQLDAQIKAISELDPSIKSFEDIVKMPNFEEFDRMVNSGYDMKHAYQIVNFDALTNKRTAAAKQAAINSVNGKSHQQPTGGTAAAGDVIVPPDKMEYLRSLNPFASDAEIKAAYARYTKG